MALERELQTYQRELSSLLEQEGKFALIADDKVIDIYGTYEDALKAGYNKVGLKPFMVKQIQAVEQVQFMTRDLGAVCLK